jgi:TonB family protein
MSLRSLLPCAFVVATLLACAARAAATPVEFCPARLADMKPVGEDKDTPSSLFGYVLHASTARAIGAAAFVADTDHGWYVWTLRDVALAEASPPKRGASSDQLSVAFPEPLMIRHAWVTSAKATSVTGFGWETLGTFLCEVPTYSDRGIAAAPVARDQARRPVASPTPSQASRAPSSPMATQAGGPALAVAAKPPFDSLDCPVPFSQAMVARAMQPQYPATFLSDTTTVQIEVAVGEQGQLLDAAVYKPSGVMAADQSALRAARRSIYTGAISYCQNVRGDYLFTATFMPHQ